MHYANFCIWIGWQDDTFLVQVRPSDDVYGMWETATGPLDLEAATTVGNDFCRRRLSIVESKELGASLYDALLPAGTVRDLYQDSRLLAFSRGHGLRIRLHITSPQLDRLPWELLYERDEGGFLILDPRYSIVRTPHVRGAKLPIRGAAPAFPLRILGAFPTPRDLPQLDTKSEQSAIDSAVQNVGARQLNVQREEQEVKEAVKEIPKDVRVEPTWLQHTTLESLVTNMPEAHVFHFGGHGTTGQNFESNFSSSSGTRAVRDMRPYQNSTASDVPDEPAYLFLEDAKGDYTPLPASKLALILRRSRVRVAVFMACDTALQSPSGESLPQLLIEAGLSAVIAMQAEVMDNITMTFGRYFYEALAAGSRIDEALSAARYITRVNFGDYFNDWAIPVLYLAPDADGLIFPERTADPSLEAARQRQPIIYVVQNIGVVSGGRVAGVEGLVAELLDPVTKTVRETQPAEPRQGPPPAQTPTTPKPRPAKNDSETT